MRVTNKMLSNGFLADMRSNLQNMRKLQQQMTSGKEVRRPSDNPFKVARSMQLHTDISANKQYNENISDTINWLDTTDTALGQVGDVLQRVRELLVAAGNAGYSENERLAIKDEINQKVGEVSQILNTNFDGAYIFGGTRGTTKPVEVIGGVDYEKASRISNIIGQNGSVDIVYGGTTYSIDISSSNSGDINKISEIINDKIGNDSAFFDLKGKVKVVPNTSENSLMVITEEDMSFSVTSDVYSTSILTDASGIDVSNTKDKSIQIGNINIALSKDDDIDAIVMKINKGINSSKELKGKVKAEVNGLNIDISSIENTLNIKIDNDTSINTDVIINISNPATNSSETETFTPNKVSISSLSNTQLVYYKKSGEYLDTVNDPYGLNTLEYNQISSKLKVQISQGVVMDYNVTATDVLKFKTAKGKELDLREIFTSITNHLDGKDSNGTTVDADTVKNLVNEDLQNITDTISNLLKIRAEVGAKQNRMDSAKEKNVEANFNMTEILSKTEDIDITEKTMEFANMQTVYLASLQTSAKILQPSLIDYL